MLHICLDADKSPVSNTPSKYFISPAFGVAWIEVAWPTRDGRQDIGVLVIFHSRFVRLDEKRWGDRRGLPGGNGWGQRV